MTESDPTTNQATPVRDQAPGNGTVGFPESVKIEGYPTVGTVADWASIVGLLISIFTAWKVLGLSRQYLFAGRVADYKKQISKHCADLNTQLAGLQFDSESVATTLSLCLTVLRPLKTSGPGIISKSAKKLRKDIAKALKKPSQLITNDFTVCTLRELRTLEEEISNHIKDRKVTPML